MTTYAQRFAAKLKSLHIAYKEISVIGNEKHGLSITISCRTMKTAKRWESVLVRFADNVTIGAHIERVQEKLNVGTCAPATGWFLVGGSIQQAKQ